MTVLTGASQTQGYLEWEELKSSKPYSHALFLEIDGSIVASYYYFIIFTIIVEGEL